MTETLLSVSAFVSYPFQPLPATSDELYGFFNTLVDARIIGQWDKIKKDCPVQSLL